MVSKDLDTIEVI